MVKYANKLDFKVYGVKSGMTALMAKKYWIKCADNIVSVFILQF